MYHTAIYHIMSSSSAQAGERSSSVVAESKSETDQREGTDSEKLSPGRRQANECEPQTAVPEAPEELLDEPEPHVRSTEHTMNAEGTAPVRKQRDDADNGSDAPAAKRLKQQTGDVAQVATGPPPSIQIQVLLRFDKTYVLQVDTKSNIFELYERASELLNTPTELFYLSFGGKMLPPSFKLASDCPLIQRDVTLSVHTRFKGSLGRVKTTIFTVWLAGTRASSEERPSISVPVEETVVDAEDKVVTPSSQLRDILGAKLGLTPDLLSTSTIAPNSFDLDVSSPKKFGYADTSLLEDVGNVMSPGPRSVAHVLDEVAKTRQLNQVIERWQEQTAVKQCWMLAVHVKPNLTTLQLACGDGGRSLKWLLPSQRVEGEDDDESSAKHAGSSASGFVLEAWTAPLSLVCQTGLDLLTKDDQGRIPICQLSNNDSPECRAIFFKLLGLLLNTVLEQNTWRSEYSVDRFTPFGLAWDKLCAGMANGAASKPVYGVQGTFEGSVLDMLLARAVKSSVKSSVLALVIHFLESLVTATPLGCGEIRHLVTCCEVVKVSDMLQPLLGRLLEKAVSGRKARIVTYFLSIGAPVTNQALTNAIGIKDFDISIELGAAAKIGSLQSVELRVQLAAICCKRQLQQQRSAYDEDYEDDEGRAGAKIVINPAQLLSGSVKFLRTATPYQLGRNLPMVTYERFDPVTQQIIPGAEVGIDEGGLLRQWMSTASEALLGNQGLRSDASGAFSLPGGGCGGAASQGKGKELVQAAQALMSSLGVPVDASEDLQDQETRCLLKLTAMSLLHGIPLGFRPAQYVSAQLLSCDPSSTYDPGAALKEQDPMLSKSLASMASLTPKDMATMADVSAFLPEVLALFEQGQPYRGNCASSSSGSESDRKTEVELVARMMSALPRQPCQLCHTRFSLVRVCHVCSVLAPDMAKALKASMMEGVDDGTAAALPFFLSTGTEVAVFTRLLGEARYPPLSPTCVKAFQSMVPQFILRAMLEPDELSQAIEGVSAAELVQLWRSKTVWLNDDSSTRHEGGIKDWFWEVVSQRPVDFLRWCTGLSSLNKLAPFEQHGKFEITVRSEQRDQHFPQVHTCSFQLDLPNYSTKSALENRLLGALEHNNFGIL